VPYGVHQFSAGDGFGVLATIDAGSAGNRSIADRLLQGSEVRSAAEPLRLGSEEAELFLAPDKLAWEQGIHGVSQNSLGPSVTQDIVIGNREREGNTR